MKKSVMIAIGAIASIALVGATAADARHHHHRHHHGHHHGHMGGHMGGDHMGGDNMGGDHMGGDHPADAGGDHK